MKKNQPLLESPGKHYSNFLRRFRLSFIALIILSLLAIGKFQDISAAGKCILSLNANGPDTVRSGGTLTYEYSLKNNGGAPCRDIHISVFYGQNESYVSSLPAPTSLDYYWRINTLRGKKTFPLYVTTKHTSDDQSFVTNEICAAAMNGETVCVMNETPVTSVAEPEKIFPETQATSSQTTLPSSESVSESTVMLPPPPVLDPILSTPVVISEPAPDRSLNEKEYGVWVWNSPLQMSLADGKATIDAAAANGFNAMYVTIDDTLTIASMAAGPAKNEAKKSYMDTLNTFIGYASQKGIAIDVEGGWKDWAEPGNEWKAFAILEFATEYNRAYPNKIRNVQYDVEPYLLDRYENNKVSVLTYFVKLIDDLVTKDTDNVGIAIAIPHFYGSDSELEQVTLNGKRASTFTHLLTSLDRRPDNLILIMSYRNYMDGPGGLVHIVTDEIREASDGAHPTKVIISQETGNVDPAYVTFFGKTKNELLTQLKAIAEYYADAPGFGGTAVHYLDPFLVLK